MNVSAAISIPLLSVLLNNFISYEISLIALFLTFIWLSFQRKNGVIYALFVLLIPYLLGLFAAIYQRNLDFSITLLFGVLANGNREYASAKALDAFFILYCPISILGFALGKRLELISDLARYGLWQYSFIRKSTDMVLRVLTLIDLASELFFRISVGLKARYIDIEAWQKKVLLMKLWAPGFLRSILLTGLARKDYLATTGIAIHKIRLIEERGMLWTEWIAVALLAIILILHFFIH